MSAVAPGSAATARGSVRSAGAPCRGASPAAALRASSLEGLSLIEVLIAMLVLSVGAASLLALFAAAAGTHRRAAERTSACLVAERILSEVRAAYLPGREPADILEALSASLPGEIEGYRHTIDVVRPDGQEWAPSELIVRVMVRWRSSQGDRSESFHAVIIPTVRIGAEERPRGLIRR